MDFQIEKNLLDLEYQKHIIIASTSIVILFTYVIGVIIALATQQIDINNLNIIIILCIISAFSLGFFLFLFFKSLIKIEKIPKIIKQLKIN